MVAIKDTSLIVAKAKSIREAQDNKDLKIAFFNATNNAIEMVKYENEAGTTRFVDDKELKDGVVSWREWFLEEHKAHHLKSVGALSATIPVGSAIDRLQKANGLVELKAVWASLTQDERDNTDILLEAQAQRKKYATK